MDMNLEQIKPAIGWIKGHLFIFVMSLLIVLFLGCGWYFSGGLNTQLVSDIEDHKKNFQKLDKASKTSVTLPMTSGDFTASGTLNKALLTSLDKLSEAMVGDIDSAQNAVLMHNGKGTKKLLVDDSVFPNPPGEKRENLPNEVHDALVIAYKSMLEAANAGAPPDMDLVEDMLLREQSRFVQADLRKTSRDELTEQELFELTSKLTQARLQQYNEIAGKISFYASPRTFQLVDSPRVTRQDHSLAEMYIWHWDWWVAEDLVSAIASANEDPSGKPIFVVNAPVKRLVSVQSLDAPFASSASGTGNSAGRQTGGSGRGGSSTPANTDGPLPEPMVGMDGSLDMDYAVSLTGRTSNKVFDVRNVRVVLIVETNKLPRLVNALGNENFITITNVSVQPANAFTAAERGYIYGANPVSRVTLDLETLWFRQWTATWMPQDVRDALGIKSKTAS